MAKYKTEHPAGGQPARQASSQGSAKDRLAALEAEKRRIEKEIADLKRQR